MARRRDAEARKLQFWQHTSKYFNAINASNDRFKQWNSDEMKQKSEDAYNRESNLAADAEAKREERLVRRNIMMDEARREFEAEMRLNRTSRHARATAPPRSTLHDLRNDYERLQAQRYERQQKDAEEKMLQHWRINNPEFRELQFKTRQDMAKKAWDEQVKADEEKKKEEERVNEEARRREEEAQRIEAEKRRDEDLRREQQVEQWKEVIEKQRAELKARESEEAKLKEEIALENKRQREVFEAEKLRKQFEDKRSKEQLGAFLKRQHRIKLLEKNKIIQEELEEDKRVLGEIRSLQAKEDAENDVKEKQSRTEQLQWLKEVLTKQKVEEERRRKEMDLLFTEEARKMWDKQEALWEKEKEARKKLMQDVINTLGKQTSEKIRLKEKRNEEILKEKESLADEIKKMELEVELEERKALKRQEIFVQDLEEQVKEKEAEKEKAAASRASSGTLKDVLVWEQKNRDKNELATKLAKISLTGDIGISDFRRKKVKWV